MYLRQMMLEQEVQEIQDTPPSPPAGNPAWSDRFAFDLALRLEGSGEDIMQILSRYNMTVDDLSKIKTDKLFQKRIVEYRADVRQNGTTFRLKARTQAEELLVTSWGLIHDPHVLPSVKADLIKSTVKWAGLEPTKDSAQDGPMGGVTIHINLDGSDSPIASAHLQPNKSKVVEHDTADDD